MLGWAYNPELVPDFVHQLRPANGLAREGQVDGQDELEQGMQPDIRLGRYPAHRLVSSLGLLTAPVAGGRPQQHPFAERQPLLLQDPRRRRTGREQYGLSLGGLGAG